MTEEASGKRLRATRRIGLRVRGGEWRPETGTRATVVRRTSISLRRTFPICRAGLLAITAAIASKCGRLTSADGNVTKSYRFTVLRYQSSGSGTAQATEADQLTVDFENVPSVHDGSSAFTFRIAFSEEVEITPEDMRDHALTVTGATVTDAARVDGRKDLWELTLAPSGSGPVSILTPLERACTEAGALCTADGRALTVGLRVQVLGPPPAPALTASFESVPQAHDGASAFTVPTSHGQRT